MITEREQFACHLHTARKAMEHAGHTLIPTRDPKAVGMCVAIVHDNRLAQFACQLHLSGKHDLLPRAGALVLFPIVVQPDLADRTYTRLSLGQFFDDRKVIIPVFVDIFRVNTDSSIYKRVFLCVADRLARGLDIAARIEDQADIMRGHGRKQLIPITVKAFIVIMCVGIK